MKPGAMVGLTLLAVAAVLFGMVEYAAWFDSTHYCARWKRAFVPGHEESDLVVISYDPYMTTTSTRTVEAHWETSCVVWERKP